MSADLGSPRAVRVALTGLAVGVVGIASLVHAASAEANSSQSPTITVTITADTVTVSPGTVAPGEVTFEVTNNASVPYELDIDGPGPDGELDNLAPGSKRTHTMTLQAGTYRLESDAESGPDNERRAMLTVRG
jgi:hypothetical protein